MKLDKPAKVGYGVFREGVDWSTVIGAAQRNYERSLKEETKPVLPISKALDYQDLILEQSKEIEKLKEVIDKALEKCYTGIRKQGGDYYLELVESILKGVVK